MAANELSPIEGGDETHTPINVVATDSMADCLTVQVNDRFGLVTLNLGASDLEARLFILLDGSDALALARALTDAALELVRRDDGGGS